MYGRVCTCGSVRTNLYVQVCKRGSVRTGPYVPNCCTYERKPVHVHGAMAGQVAIHKTRNWTLFIDIANETAPVCTRIFPGYIDENAIQNNFQRVPPLPDGSVCKFPAIAVETEPSNLTAPFVYQRLCDTQIQKRGSIVLFTHYSQRNAPNRRPMDLYAKFTL